MGIISKHVHQRKTNRLAEPVRAVTRLDLEGVLRALRETIAATPARTGFLQNGRKLWLFGAAPGPWQVYWGPPGHKQPDKVVPVWEAHVDIRSGSNGGETLVTIELMRWKTRDGELVERKDFERFRNQFATRLLAADPSYRLLYTEAQR